MRIFLCLTLISSFTITARAALVAYGSTKYLQASDSPWYQGIQNGSIHLEDFKDGLLNTPFVSSNGEIRGPGDRRSVDADDGFLDGRGENGGTWGIGIDGPFSFEFEPNAEGLLPAFVGIVVTRETRQTELFTAYDNNGQILGALDFDVAPLFARSGPEFQFDSSEARFVGVYASEGISRFTLRWATMTDHLQYGYAIPEPMTAGSVCAGLVLFAFRRRRSSWFCFNH